jgi:HD-GYP domain-containing protein (c-di-GMP phosphodiesterase class II)
VPVIDGGRNVGRIVLVSDISDFATGLISVLLTAAAGSAIALAVGLLLAFRLQRSITRPLITLADAMAKTTRDQEYGVPVDVSTDDETGVLASSFNSMTREIRKATDAIMAREEEMILRLCRAAEQRDDQTGEHILRVAKLSWIVARGLGLGERECRNIYRAAPMHDVGKIGVPDAILFKPGRLDPDERRQMERHAEYGYHILRDSNSALVQLAAEIALSHHERWDGAGYPRKLKREDIPLSGRITALADVCDALASPRPYKHAWSLEEVQHHLLESSGSHFDPACVGAIMKHWGEVERLYASASAPAAVAPVAAAAAAAAAS